MSKSKVKRARKLEITVFLSFDKPRNQRKEQGNGLCVCFGFGTGRSRNDLIISFVLAVHFLKGA